MRVKKLTTTTNDISPRKIALIAGLGMLIMTIFAIFPAIYGPTNLIVSEDATATANNIIANGLQFRVGVFSYVVVIILDLVVAWALYVFLKPVNKSLSSLAALFRIVYAILFAASLTNYLNILQLLSGANYLTVIATNQLHSQVMLSLKAFSDGWGVAYIFFGLHLALTGYLVFKYRPDSCVTKGLGIVLAISCSGYLIEYMGKIVFPNSAQVSMILGWGELLLLIWLLLKGGSLKSGRKV